MPAAAQKQAPNGYFILGYVSVTTVRSNQKSLMFSNTLGLFGLQMVLYSIAVKVDIYIV